MSTGSRGFGVEAGQLQQVARQYDGEGVDIAALADDVVTNVGEGQVGRAFGAVAAPYQQAFAQFGRNLVAFGHQVGSISLRLTRVYATYERTEDARARGLREVY